MDKSALESLYLLIEEISDQEIKEQKNINKAQNRRIFSYFFWICLFPFIIAAMLALLNKYCFKESLIGDISLVILSFTYLAIMLQPLHSAWIFRKSIFLLFRNPFVIILNNSKNIAISDNASVKKLLEKPIDHLKFLSLELKAEHNAFTKRISLIIGAIEKIGILPGILALLVVFIRLGDKEQSEWVYVLIYINPALYIAGAGMHLLLNRLERINMLIEYIVEQKELASTKKSKECF